MARTFTDWEGTCLMHHGIKGQRWGVRRFQNPDGTLTPEGVKRYGKRLDRLERKENKAAEQAKHYFELAKQYTSPYGYSFIEGSARQYEKANRINKKRLKLGDPKAIQELKDRVAKQIQEQDERNEQSFNKFREAIKKDGAKGVFSKAEEDSALMENTFNHISKKESKLIDEWWNKKTSGWRGTVSSEAFSAEAKRYAMKAARDLGLPANDQTLYFLLDWFFNGDD